MRIALPKPIPDLVSKCEDSPNNSRRSCGIYMFGLFAFAALRARGSDLISERPGARLVPALVGMDTLCTEIVMVWHAGQLKNGIERRFA